jgi:DNA sulfur modification protein DndE
MLSNLSYPTLIALILIKQATRVLQQKDTFGATNQRRKVVLPDAIKISAFSENTLRSLKGKTGIDKNLIARIAISRSLGNEYRQISPDIDSNGDRYPKSILLGEFAIVYDLLLANLHEKNFQTDDMSLELVNHLESGLSGLRGVPSLQGLLDQITR